MVPLLRRSTDAPRFSMFARIYKVLKSGEQHAFYIHKVSCDLVAD